jgi:hypothetical protein
MRNARLFKLNLGTLTAIVAYFAVLFRFLLTPIAWDFVEQWGSYCAIATIAGVLAGIACLGLSLLVVRASSWIMGSSRPDQNRFTSSFDPGRWVFDRVARWFSSRSPRMARLVIGLAWSALLSILLYAFCEWVTGGFLRELVQRVLDRTVGGFLPETLGPSRMEWLYYNLFCNVLGTSIVFVSFTVFAIDPNTAAKHLGRFLRPIILPFVWFLRLAYGPSPAWLRIILAWMMAELSVPIAHLIVSLTWIPEDFSDPSVWFLIVLLCGLVVALSMLIRAVYDLSRSSLPNPQALALSGLLGYLFSFLFFRFSGHL